MQANSKLVKNNEHFMKIGIILPCNNIEKGINLSNILSLIDMYSHIHFCFVNNGSSDNTLNILEYIRRESTGEVSILDLKKKKNLPNVVKAGARYLNTKEEIDYTQAIEVDFTINFQKLIYLFDSNILKEHEFYENTVIKQRPPKKSN